MGWMPKRPPETVRVTTSLARAWAKMESIQGDRPLDAARMRRHRATYDAGGFRPVSWARAHCAANGKTYRVNGRHTSSLFGVVDLAGGQPLYAVIEEYACDTLADVAALHATFDSRDSVRTANDVNRAYAAADPGLAGVEARTLGLLAAGLGFAEWPGQFGGRQHTQAERAALLLRNVPFCQWVAREFSWHDDNARKVLRAPVVSVMARTYRVDAAAAHAFWAAVRDETGAAPETPDRRLAKFLDKHRVAVGAARQGPARYRTRPREFVAVCVACWSAWRAGAPVYQIKYNAKYPIPDPA